MSIYPSDQHNDDSAVPVRIVSGTITSQPTSSGNISVTTNADGKTYEAFADQACSQMVVSNQTGTVINLRQDGADFQIPSGILFTVSGVTNANQISVARTDAGTTPVTVTARWSL